MERTFHKLRADQNDDGHSSDDEEIYQAAKRIFMEREEELLGMKGLAEEYDEKDCLQMAID